MGNQASSSSTRTVSPAVKSFLDPLERLSHVERIRHLLDVGKKCVREPPYTAPATDVPAVELLQMLSSSGVHYHRLMATFALRGAAEKLVHTNDNAVMVSMKDICYTLLNDSCKDIQVNCLRPAVYLSTADELQKILSELPVCLLDDFCHVLLKKRPAEAQPLLDAFLPRTTASRRRWVLAKYASETVLEATPAVKEGVLYWPPLALHQLTVAQPNWVTSHFTALAAQTPADALHPLPLRTALRTVMLALGDGDRKEQLQKGLALVQAELPRSATCKKEINEVLRVYVKKAPVALDAVEYVVANKAVYHGLVSLSFSRAGWKVLVTRLDLVAELVKMDALPELFDWGFFHLPKEVRRFLYQNYRPKMLNSADNMIPINLIEHLPDEADRHTEARHAWAQPALKTDPYEHMGCLSLLPFDEAKERGKEYIADPKPEHRQRMADVLSRSARLQSALDGYLQYCVQRKNEQDPIQEEMMDGLCRFSPQRWQSSHLADMQVVVDALLGKPDTSRGTIDTLIKVLIRISVHHFTSEVQQMLRKVYIRTDRWSEMIESIIPFPTRKAVLLWLLPQYIVKAEKSDFTTSSVLIFGDHFLKRVMVQEPAFKAFVTKLMAIREDRSAIDALSLIVKFYPMEELLPLVTSLVQEEPDAMGEWHIANSTLPGRSRGEVLHKFLKPVQFTGRFQRHRDRPSLIHFRKECFSSWTAEQQHTYAESLIEELRNKTNRSMWAKRSLLELLCALPSYESDQLFATFATEDKYDDNFVIKSFMENMRHMRDEASLQELLRICQEGKRGAEAAGRALRCRLRHYSSEAVLQRTKPLLTSSDVSIPFQISFLRILSDIRCEEGFQAMCTYYDQHENTQEEDDDDRLHLAYVKELTNHLDKEEAWRRLEKEVEKADSHAVLCQLCGVANEKLTDAASITRYDQSILRRILGHPIAEEERKVRIAVVRRYLGFKGKESTIFPELQTVCFNALEDRKSKLQLLSFRLLLSYDEIDIPTTAAAVLAVKNDLSLRALLLPLLNTTDHTPLYRRNALALSEALYRGMIAAGRQIGLAFRLLFIGSSRKWTAEEQKLLQNGVLHVRRYAEWVDALQKECHSNPCRSREELWSVENVCRKEEKDVLLQQTGLTLVEVLAEKWGYGEEERKAIQFYRGLQQNPWTRDAALLVQLPGE